MSLTFRRALTLGLTVMLLAGAAACASKPNQVRHLAAEVGMINHGDSAQQVEFMLGPPDVISPLENDAEEWLYLEHRQNWLRQTRLLGNWLGREDFHLAVVTIRDDRVSDARYRELTAEDYQQYLDQYLENGP